MENLSERVLEIIDKCVESQNIEFNIIKVFKLTNAFKTKVSKGELRYAELSDTLEETLVKYEKPKSVDKEYIKTDEAIEINNLIKSLLLDTLDDDIALDTIQIIFPAINAAKREFDSTKNGDTLHDAALSKLDKPSKKKGCTNDNLHAAKREKNDEFYTQLSDIEKELKYYKKHFKGKTVYCNCDDARESNFFKYFAKNFHHLGLKQLVTTSYKKGSKGAALIYRGEFTGDNIDDYIVEVKNMKGDGDFRSEQSLEVLQKADIVVTNPPFSLFREYIAQLMEYNKKFLIIGNQNAITNKEMFPLIKDGHIWLGKTMPKEFMQPNGEMKKFGNICWYTNLDNHKYEEPIALTAEYSPEKYPEYDNYNAINVDKIKEIPYDYDGVMGVPITIINYVANDGLIHCENLDLGDDINFKIIWQASGNTKASAPDSILDYLNYINMKEDKGGAALLHNERVYTRVLIQKV